MNYDDSEIRLLRALAVVNDHGKLSSTKKIRNRVLVYNNMHNYLWTVLYSHHVANALST